MFFDAKQAAALARCTRRSENQTLAAIDAIFEARAPHYEKMRKQEAEIAAAADYAPALRIIQNNPHRDMPGGLSGAMTVMKGPTASDAKRMAAECIIQARRSRTHAKQHGIHAPAASHAWIAQARHWHRYSAKRAALMSRYKSTPDTGKARSCPEQVTHDEKIKQAALTAGISGEGVL